MRIYYEWQESLRAAESLLDSGLDDDAIVHIVDRAHAGERSSGLPKGALRSLRVITGRAVQTETSHRDVLRTCWVAAILYGYGVAIEEPLNRNSPIRSRLRPDLVLWDEHMPVFVCEYKPAIKHPSALAQAVQQVTGYADAIEDVFEHVDAAVLSHSFYDLEECAARAEAAHIDVLDPPLLFKVLQQTPWTVAA